MIGNSLSRLLALGLVLALLLTVGGETAAQDDAGDVIAQALALLAEADSYAYTVTMDTSQQITDESGEVFGVRQRYDIAGEASGADYHDAVTLTVVPLEAEDDAQTTTLERVRVGETLYVQLDDLLAEQLGVETGWWALDALLDTLGDDSVRRFSAEQLAQLPTPATLTIDADLIRGVEALADDEIEGVPVRVFDVEMKAVEIALAQQAEAGFGDRLASYLENAALLLQSEFSLTYRLYVGAEDGRLYRAESASRSYIPYLEFGGPNNPDYDIDMSTTLTFDIRAYGEPVQIEAPANSAGKPTLR